MQRIAAAVEGLMCQPGLTEIHGAEVDFARRKQNAVQAYYEWIPIRAVNGANYPENLSINRTFPIGTFRVVTTCTKHITLAPIATPGDSSC